MKVTISRFFRWFIQPLTRFWDKPYSLQYVEDPVDYPKNKILYVIGTADEPWQVEMACPCGCKDKIVLPVNNSTAPRWRLNIISNNSPSLSPSVWRSRGCKSHFYLKYGKIEWC